MTSTLHPAPHPGPTSERFALSWRVRGFAALRQELWLVLVLVQCGMVAAASAQTMAPGAPAPLSAVGTVKTLSGQAFLDFNGQRTAAAPGLPVYLGTRLVTDSSGSLGVVFRDETVMSIGPDTQLVIDQYLFAPRLGQLGLVVSLLRGTLNYVSGQIAKLRPDSVNVNTPTGMIGVRGTQFVVRVDPT